MRDGFVITKEEAKDDGILLAFSTGAAGEVVHGSVYLAPNRFWIRVGTEPGSGSSSDVRAMQGYDSFNPSRVEVPEKEHTLPPATERRLRDVAGKLWMSITGKSR